MLLCARSICLIKSNKIIYTFFLKWIWTMMLLAPGLIFVFMCETIQTLNSTMRHLFRLSSSVPNQTAHIRFCVKI